VHALSNTLSALGQGFALAMACCARCQLVGPQVQCMILVEVVAHASLKTFGHFALSCGCGVASRPLSLIGGTKQFWIKPSMLQKKNVTQRKKIKVLECPEMARFVIKKNRLQMRLQTRWEELSLLKS
jgi:hypothetical protein